MVKGIIFDLDGVLVSTDELHYTAWLAMAEREGIAFDRAVNRRLRGVSRMQSLDIILERAPRAYSAAEKAALAAYKNELYVALLDALTAADVLPGVLATLDALDALAARGVRLAVGSSSKNAKKILSKTGLIGRFDAIADGTDIVHSKPDPEVFLCAAERLGLAPVDCAVVEDAEAGIEAAKAGGMLACAIGDACRSELADVTLARISELVEKLERR